YVLDVARALTSLVEKTPEAYRVYNVGTGQEYSVEEIVEELARITGRPLRIAVAANRVRPADRMHLLCDRSRIEKEIGWAPEYGMQSGLAALWDWTNQQAASPKEVATAI